MLRPEFTPSQRNSTDTRSENCEKPAKVFLEWIEWLMHQLCLRLAQSRSKHRWAVTWDLRQKCRIEIPCQRQLALDCHSQLGQIYSGAVTVPREIFVRKNLVPALLKTGLWWKELSLLIMSLNRQFVLGMSETSRSWFVHSRCWGICRCSWSSLQSGKQRQFDRQFMSWDRQLICFMLREGSVDSCVWDGSWEETKWAPLRSISTSTAGRRSHFSRASALEAGHCSSNWRHATTVSKTCWYSGILRNIGGQLCPVRLRHHLCVAQQLHFQFVWASKEPRLASQSLYPERAAVLPDTTALNTRAPLDTKTKCNTKWQIHARLLTLPAVNTVLHVSCHYFHL